MNVIIGHTVPAWVSNRKGSVSGTSPPNKYDPLPASNGEGNETEKKDGSDSFRLEFYVPVWATAKQKEEIGKIIMWACKDVNSVLEASPRRRSPQ